MYNVKLIVILLHVQLTVHTSTKFQVSPDTKHITTVEQETRICVDTEHGQDYMLCDARELYHILLGHYPHQS